MKIKRFKNLWTMGLILFGAILVLFYVAKIFFPEFIVGVAEIPSIVEFGNFVDSNSWAYYLYHFVISVIGSILYFSACCRKIKFSLKEYGIISLSMAIGIVLQAFMPTLYTPYSYVIQIFAPFVILFVSKGLTSKTFVSTAICFSVDIMSQALSSIIRDIFPLVSAVNSATITILLIDVWIWRILLCLFFNNKTQKGD